MGAKFRVVTLGFAFLLLLLAGCAFFQRKIDPGPDGKYGTSDDIVMGSDAESAGEIGKTLADIFGLGWIGLALQGASIVATNVVSTKKGLKPMIGGSA